MFPEVVAVNALYTHGLVVIVSTHVRYGGFAISVRANPSGDVVIIPNPRTTCLILPVCTTALPIK
jgi:hypothetical protein